MTTPTTQPPEPTAATAGAARPEGASPPGAERITVAVDGTDAGLRAVRWATDEATVRNGTLTIVHAAPYAAGSTGSLREHATRILGRAFTVARRRAPGLDVHTSLLEDAPLTALVEASRQTDLLVVGIAIGQHVEDALIGSLAIDLAGRVHAPLAVVHRSGTATGPVVAAVGEPEEDASVIAQAYFAAARYGSALEIVHSARSALDAAQSRDTLDRMLRHCAQEIPGVPTALHIVRERPLEAIVERSSTARLLVVGPGDGHWHLLGSVGRTALRLAACPVLVAIEDEHPGKPAWAAPEAAEQR